RQLPMVSSRDRQEPLRAQAWATRLDVPEAIIADSQEARVVLEEFRPLAESLEWIVGQRHFWQQGSAVFTSDAVQVPYVVNNDGTLAKRAAELLFRNLAVAEEMGTLEANVFVVELGIGVGLFARFFLDSFRDLCRVHGKGYYERLHYVAGDRSD